MTLRSANNLGALLRSYEALHNWRALVMLIGSFVLGGLLISGGGAIAASAHSALVFVLLALLGLIVIVVGANGTGLLLIDQAYDQPQRSFSAAFFGGISVALSVIGLWILMAIGFAVVLIVAFILSLLGRIPGIGGFFAFLFAGPLALVVAAAVGVFLLAFPLMVAAVWHGEGFLGSLSRAVSIVLRRPLEVFMHFLVLTLIVTPAAAFLFGLLGLGSLYVGSMFAKGAFDSAMGAGYGMGSGYGGMVGYGGMGGMGGVDGMIMSMAANMAASGTSIALAWFLIFALIALIFGLGTIFVYRAVGEGVSSADVELLKQKFGELRQKIDEHKPRAVAPGAAPPPAAYGSADAPAAAAAPSAPTPAPASTEPLLPAASGHCPACGAAVGADDVFCGNCGHKLR